MDFAKAWKPEADRIWKSREHRDTHTQYFRDTEEGKAYFAGCGGNCQACASAQPKAAESTDNAASEKADKDSAANTDSKAE